MSDVDLAEKVREWLDGQGYPLELRAGRVFEEHGWDADHRTWYLDESTGATREVDLVVTKYLTSDNDHSNVAFSLVVECKRSVEKPWAVLSSTVPNILFLRSVFPRSLSQDADHAARIDGGARMPTALLPRTGRIGHGIVAAFAEKGSNAPMSPYSALRAVSDATHAIDRASADMSLRMGADHASVTVLAPLVVLDGRLFECFLDDEGSGTVVQETGRSTVIHPNDPPGKLDVTIVTMTGLDDFVTELSAQVDTYLQALLPYAASVVERHRDRRRRMAARLHGES